MNVLSDSQTSEASIIFLHLPKTAGTTLKDIIARQYKEEQIYQLDNVEFNQAQQDFKQLDSANKAKIRMLMGHMYFGLHEYLNFPAKYVTMLRNPIDRVISYYYFVKKLPIHPDYELIQKNNISLKEYCRLGRENMCNGQTRFLSGTKESETCTPDTLIKVKQSLQKHFLMVGFQEKFDQSLLLMQDKLGWRKRPFYYQRNTNRSHTYNARDISSDTLATIEKYNEMDLELYEYASQVFEKELSQSPLNLEQNLKQFRFSNQMFGRYFVLGQKLIAR